MSSIPFPDALDALFPFSLSFLFLFLFTSARDRFSSCCVVLCRVPCGCYYMLLPRNIFGWDWLVREWLCWRVGLAFPHAFMMYVVSSTGKHIINQN